MQKNELELRKLVIDSQKFGLKIKLAQHFLTLFAVVYCVYLIMHGLGEMVKAKPDSIGALANVIEKLQVNAILGWVVSAGLGIGWKFERNGKKRAIRKTSELRSELTKKDPHNESSQLDENGHTPK